MEHNPRMKSLSSKTNTHKKNKCWVRYNEFGDIFRTKSRPCCVNALLVWFSPIYLYFNSTLCYSLAVKVPKDHVLKTVLTLSLRACRNLRGGAHVLKRNCGAQVSFSLLNPSHQVSIMLHSTPTMRYHLNTSPKAQKGQSAVHRNLQTCKPKAPFPLYSK